MTTLQFESTRDMQQFRAGAHCAVGSLEAAFQAHSDEADVSIETLRQIFERTKTMIDDVMDKQEATWVQSCSA